MDLATRFQVLRMFFKLVGRVPLGHLWYLARRLPNEKPHRFKGQIRINTFFPPYPSPAYDRFFEALIRKRRVPYSTYLAVTHECPYSCPHCSSARRSGGPMTMPKLLHAVQQIKSVGACTIGFTGGEPLLCEGLEELIRAARPEMATVIFTSGEGLTEERVQKLSSTGVDCVTVGLESSLPEEHDRIRGMGGSFLSARHAVQASREAGIYTALSTIGTREKIERGDLERIYEIASDWGVGEMRILAPVATGGLAGCAAAMLRHDELKELARFQVNKNRLPGGPAVANFAYLESNEMFGCGAGYHHLFIDASGEVCPCDLTPLSFGNLNDVPLQEIWELMGRHFPLPRCGCLMGDLGARAVSHGVSLPLPPEKSKALCPPPPKDRPLPEIYRRLFKRRAP